MPDILRYITHLLVCWPLFFAPNVNAQTRLSDSQKTFLWEVSGKDLPAPSFLFGSLHILVPEWLDSFPDVRQKFNSANIYVGERLLENFTPSLNAVQSDTPVLKLLRPDQYRFLDSFLKVNFQGASLSDSEALHMNMIDLLGMIRTYYSEKVLRDSSQGATLDLYLQQEAKRRNLRMIGLETETELNRRYIEGRSQQALVDLFIDILKTMTAQPTWLLPAEALIAEYRDLRIQYDFTKTSGNPRMFENRNRAWMPALLTNLRSGSCFVHVGLGHLQYYDGLIGLLRRAGYTVRPLPATRRKK